MLIWYTEYVGALMRPCLFFCSCIEFTAFAVPCVKMISIQEIMGENVSKIAKGWEKICFHY